MLGKWDGKMRIFFPQKELFKKIIWIKKLNLVLLQAKL